MMRSLATTALVAVALAGDVPVPAEMQGKYKGSVYQQYGTADPKNPQSYECITDSSVKTGGSMAANNVDTELKENTASFGSYKESSKVVNNAKYGMAGREASTYEWADWSGSGSTGGIVKLRTKDGKIVCRYAKFSGGKLTMVTLGGSAFTWEDQCNLNAYKSIKNFETQAYCEPVGSGNRAPLKSTTLEIYSGKTGGKSGASTALVAAAVGAVGAAAAVVLL